MKILLLLPILFYVSLVFFNIDLLKDSQIINIFNFYTFDIPALLYSSIFMIWYLIFVFIIFDIRWVFLKRKIDNQEHEIIWLKSMLYDEREDILKKFISEYNLKLDNFTKEQRELFDKFKAKNEMDLMKQKSETDRILDKLNLIDKWVFDKIKETFKK